MIELRGIEKRYQTAEVETTVFTDLDLTVDEGELMVVTGESGSGKSTLLNILGLLEPPSAGTYRFKETLVRFQDAKAIRKLRAEHVGFVFQEFHLVDRLRVIDNVLLPIRCRRRVGSDDRRLAISLLDRVGLKARSRHYPHQLSGGQRQRVAIARALITASGLILADEPTGNLDSTTSREVISLLQELNSEGTTVVIATHSREVASIGYKLISLGGDGIQ